MSIFPEYAEYDATGLAELVKKKKVTPAELVESALDRINRLNPELNAVVIPMDDWARKDAADLVQDSNRMKGAFAGVPLLLKDLLAAVKGIPLTNGSAAFQSQVPGEDSDVVRLLKNEGFIICGKTNTPELGTKGITEPKLYGPTKNPWDTSRTPGGSSGGSGAAVASGMVPVAGAGDGGGSIRIPASHGGIFGLKPTRGLLPTGPFSGENWLGATVEGVLSRTVRDTAAMLDILAVPDPGAPYYIRRPDEPYIKALKKKVKPLRIAFSAISPYGTKVDSTCVDAVTATAKLLESMGHHVEQTAPPVDGQKLAESYLTMCYAEVAQEVEEAAKILGRKAKAGDFELDTWMMAKLGHIYSAADLAGAKRFWDHLGRIMQNFHNSYDLLLLPSVGAPPIKIGALDISSVEKIFLKAILSTGLTGLLKSTGMVTNIAIKNLGATPFTQLANLTGAPAMSVPLYWTGDGLPVGSQFIAPMAGDTLLLSLAAQLEKEQPWFDKRPPVR